MYSCFTNHDSYFETDDNQIIINILYSGVLWPNKHVTSDTAKFRRVYAPSSYVSNGENMWKHNFVHKYVYTYFWHYCINILQSSIITLIRLKIKHNVINQSSYINWPTEQWHTQKLILEIKFHEYTLLTKTWHMWWLLIINVIYWLVHHNCKHYLIVWNRLPQTVITLLSLTSISTLLYAMHYITIAKA